jgi:predicted kinase
MTLELVMCKGIPASGKSTWAKEWVAKYPGQRARVNKDDLRLLLHNGQWSKSNEKQVVAARDAMIRALLARGISVVSDDTNFGPHEATFREMAKEYKASFRIESFEDVPLETCIDRDRKRGAASVGEKVIKRMYRDFLYTPPVYEPPVGKPHAIIVDMDGTLAQMNDNRGPYEDHLCETDLPNEPIVNLVAALAATGVAVLIMSGRDEGRARKPTIAWLNKHLPVEVSDGALFMRPAGDTRKDSIVKRELFDAHVRDNYQIDLVVDDRNSVVEMWRGLGLTVLQCALGDF